MSEQPTPCSLWGAPWRGLHRSLLDRIGLDVPANDERRDVLAPVKVRCSQSSPCSL
jgi:hypothetical protein